MRAIVILLLALASWLAAPCASAQTEPPPEPGSIEELLGSPAEPEAYAQVLRQVLRREREKVLSKIDEKFEAAQEKRVGRISSVLSWFSLFGLLLLGMPLVLGRRYPGKTGLLFKYSLVAAATFVVTTLLFSQVLTLLRAAQGAAASITNPQRNIAEAAFDVLDEEATELAVIGPTLLAQPIAKVASGEEESIVSAILNNAEALNADARVFKRIAGWFTHVSELLGYVPTILTLLAVVAFLVSMRPVLGKIVRLPAEAAEGRASGKRVVGEIAKTLGWELVVTLLLIVVLVAITLLSGFMLATLARPAVEALLAYGFACIFYTVALEKTFQTGLIYVSLVGAMLFLVLNVAIVVASSGLFIGKAQKLLRLRFHDRVSFTSQWRFWLLGPVALAWVQSIPIVFIAVAKPAVENFIDWSMKSGEPADIDWSTLLTSGPLVLVIGFLLFWLCWGLGPLLFVARYPTKQPVAPSAVPARAPAASYA